MKEQKRKRILGSIGWAIILSFLATILFGFWAGIDLPNRFTGWITVWSFVTFFQAFIFFLFPTEFLSILIGIYAEPPARFWVSTAIIIPVVTVIYTFFLWFSLGFGKALSDNPSRETFWHPASIGISAIIFGVILGSVASYGYWHAGRKYKNQK